MEPWGQPFSLVRSKNVKRRSYIKEEWKAEYKCKSCENVYTQTNKAANQKRICPQCRKMNHPFKEVKQNHKKGLQLSMEISN